MTSRLAARAVRALETVGCDAFVAKPFRVDELLDLVHRQLREAEG